MICCSIFFFVVTIVGYKYRITNKNKANLHWIGSVGKTCAEHIFLTSNFMSIEVSCKFSHHPALGYWTPPRNAEKAQQVATTVFEHKMLPFYLFGGCFISMSQPQR
jgi:hypothetical protein